MTPVRFERHGACAVLTIDRPEARNAISPEVARGIEEAVDALEAAGDLRAGVLAGAPPVFCAGADLRAVGEGRGAELSTERGGFGGLVRRRRTKPLVAAVDGPALAGGMELVLACDVAVASTRASFGLPEVRRGLIAAAGGLVHLGSILPRAVALELVLTGAPMDAEAAHRHGLVTRLCEPGEALGTALEVAEAIAAGAPVAVRLSREVLLAARDLDEEEAWARSDAANAEVLATEDVQEGVRAFLEKRPPAWRGS